MSADNSTLGRHLKTESLTNPWGPGPKNKNTSTFEQCVGLSVAEYDGLGIHDAIHRLDHLLFAFTLHTHSTDGFDLEPQSSSTTGNGHPSQNLGVDSLRKIQQDRDWVDALLAMHEEKWMTGGFDGKGLAVSIGSSVGIREESETMVHFFAMRQGDVASFVCEYFPGVGPESIEASIHASAGGFVGRDHVVFYAHNQGELRLFERREDKTLELMVHHAHALDAIVDCGLDDIESDEIREMFAQAYTSSISEPRCVTVWMGHPALYRIAYIFQRCLFLSHWLSSEPVRIKSLLESYKPWTSPILQAHLVHETLALAKIGANEFDAFLAARPPQLNPVVNFFQTLKDPFEILRTLSTSPVVLGEDTFFGAAKFSSEHLALTFPSTIKPRRVWANSKMVAKVVGAEELETWGYIAGLNLLSVPSFKGTVTLSSRPNTGRILILLTHCGEPVTDVGLDSEEVSSTMIRANVSSILHALRMHGIHHHDIHGGNVVRHGDRVFITDFGSAVRAQDCTMGSECPDLVFLLEPEVPELV